MEDLEKADSYKLYLEHIAKKWGKTVKEVLYLLIPHNIIYAPISNVTFRSRTTGFSLFQPATDMPIPESNLQVIYSKGFWIGKMVLIKDTLDEKPHITEANFDSDVTIAFNDLFVHEHDLIRIKEQYSEIFVVQPDQNDNTENNPMVIAAWRAAINIYEQKHMKSQNDPLPKRMRVLLRYLEGESFTKLEDDTRRNISRDLNDAKSKDILVLMDIFPELKPLNLDK